eukprot:540098_1
MTINDSLEITVQFIYSSIHFISNLVASNSPFQIDMCIAVGAPVLDYDDDDDDDDFPGSGFVDCIGNIEDKLKQNSLKYKFSVQQLTKEARMFDDVYNDFVDEHKLEGKDDKTEYLHQKRLIAFVDRR